MTEALVLESAGTQLVCGNHSRYAFHIHGNINLEFSGRRRGSLWVRRETQEVRESASEKKHTATATQNTHEHTSNNSGSGNLRTGVYQLRAADAGGKASATSLAARIVFT